MLTWNIDEDDNFFLGEDKILAATIYQSNGRTLQNITGWTLSWMLKRSLADTDAEALLTRTTSDTISLTSPTVGQCTVSITDTQTDSLEPGRYYHELKRTNAGEETVLSHGRCVLRRGVHRS